MSEDYKLTIMKELTIEQKAKRYDEAIERARELLDHGLKDTRDKRVVLSFFPEPKESEDERIRKTIIRFFKDQYSNETEMYDGSVTVGKALAWLEKQKEPELSEDLGEYVTELNKQFPEVSFAKLSRIAVRVKNWLEKQGEQKPADKAKPFDKYEGLTDFERTLADICIGWIGEELGWKQYIKDNANVLLKIAIEKFNSVQDTPFEQKPIIEMKSAEESLGISSEEYNDIVNEYLYGESESSDKVELKFKVGDWITNGDYTWKIIEVKPLDYILQSQDGNIVDDTISHVDEQFHSFTIKDAKDGDVLATDKSVFIYAKTLYNKPYAYCGVDKYGVFKDNCLKNNWANSVNNILPANKEQRDTLMKAMADAGYTFDFEKKELKKIEAVELTEFEEALFTAFSDGWQQYLRGEEINVAQWAKEHSIELLKVARQNFTAWSNEDEERLNSCLYVLEAKSHTGQIDNDNTIWLKNLKQRMVSAEVKEALYDKPTDEEMKELLRTEYEKGRADVITEMKSSWSEEDETGWTNTMIMIKEVASNHYTKDSIKLVINWLESLKDRYTWKPSDEQMNVFKQVYDWFNTHFAQSLSLNSLYYDLKKLKEE